MAPSTTLRRSLPTLLTPVIALAIAACAPVDSVVHEGDGDSEGEEARGGNFPSPAVDVCGALPEGVAPIAGLASAHGLSGARVRQDLAVAMPPESVRLRLSSRGYAAEDPYPTTDECDGEGWGFGIDLPAGALVAGVHDLAELSGVVEYFDFDDACGGGAGGGIAPSHHFGAIELFVATDACLVGALRDVDVGLPAVRDGGFVAQRVALPCVDVLDDRCD
jgi:hypothetical protein